jgi:hypothetical protein
MKTNPEWQKPKKKKPSAGSIASRKIEIHVICSEEESERFDTCLGDLHYLGATRPIGHFLRQVAVCNGEWIALLAWGPACYSLQDRDEWIGWNPALRAERLNLIVQNRRFLLLHERNSAPNLASKVLAASMRALPAHWKEHFGYEPLMVETFTDLERFHGTCYKACGWIEAGESQGFGRDAIDFFVYHGKIKRLWIKELSPNARAMLCAPSLPDCIPDEALCSAHGQLPFKAPQLRSLMEALQTVPDPRIRKSRYRLGSVLSIAAMALLCGYRDIAEITRFAQRLTQPQREKIGLPLKKGTAKFREVPNYQMFYRLLSTVDPEKLAEKLTEWLREQSGTLPGALAMDGKFIRDTIGVLTLADHETGAPEAMDTCSKKKARAKSAK